MFLGGVLGWERESARKPADTDLGSRAGGRRFLLWGLLAVAIVLVMIWLVWGFRRPPTAALFTGASGSIGRCHVGKTDFLRLAG